MTQREQRRQIKFVELEPKRHQGHQRTRGGIKRGTRGTGGHTGDPRDTGRTGGHSDNNGGIGRDTKRTGGNNGGVGAGRKARGICWSTRIDVWLGWPCLTKKMQSP
jgi:hypothetical protein